MFNGVHAQIQAACTPADLTHLDDFELQAARFNVSLAAQAATGLFNSLSKLLCQLCMSEKLLRRFQSEGWLGWPLRVNVNVEARAYAFKFQAVQGCFDMPQKGVCLAVIS